MFIRMPGTKTAKNVLPMTYWRNVIMPAKLDLWLIKFSDQVQESRAKVIRDALYKFLREMDPEGEPVGTNEEILRARWQKRTQPGRWTLVYEKSTPAAIQARIDRGKSPDC